MRIKEYNMYKICLLVSVVMLSALSGCAYQAKLLDTENLKSGGVIVECKVVKEPIIKVSQSGDFIFWWAGGPGPITFSLASVVNESNNQRYRKMLKPALEVDYFCEQFEANLTDAVQEEGLWVEQIKIEHDNLGIPIWSNLDDLDVFIPFEYNGYNKYLLRMKVSCGLFKSEARTIAQLEGRLIRIADNKLLWKNKLSFEGLAGGVHKKFGHGYESIEQWDKDELVLQEHFEQVIAGVTRLLARELSDTDRRQGDLTEFHLKDGTKVKGIVIDQSPERIVLRLKGGAIRSILADKTLAMNN